MYVLWLCQFDGAGKIWTFIQKLGCEFGLGLGLGLGLRLVSGLGSGSGLGLRSG